MYIQNAFGPFFSWDNLDNLLSAFHGGNDESRMRLHTN